MGSCLVETGSTLMHCTGLAYLELPRSGESMVPCLDMVNHSAKPTAYYEENAKDEVALLLRPGVVLFAIR